MGQLKEVFYQPELDVVRAIAFLMVFFHHSYGLFLSSRLRLVGEACSSGLQLFFLLSAFLITELLLRERDRTGTVRIRAFFARRILRIWPLYIFFITFSLVLALVFHHGNFPLQAYFSFLLLSGNWYVYMHGFLTSVVGPLWSISVEEQFYVVWPFLILLGGRRALRGAILPIFVLSYGALWYSGEHHLARVRFWSNSLVEFQFFASGALLALLLHDRRFAVPRGLRILFLCVSATAFGLIAFRFPVTDLPLTTGNLLAAFTLMNVMSLGLIAAFFGVRLPKGSGPLVFLGRISYGMYVYHALALSVFKGLARQLPSGPGWKLAEESGSFVLCTAFAVLSFRILEQPFLRLKKRFSVVPSRDDLVAMPS